MSTSFATFVRTHHAEVIDALRREFPRVKRAELVAAVQILARRGQMEVDAAPGVPELEEVVAQVLPWLGFACFLLGEARLRKYLDTAFAGMSEADREDVLQETAVAAVVQWRPLLRVLREQGSTTTFGLLKAIAWRKLRGVYRSGFNRRVDIDPAVVLACVSGGSCQEGRATARLDLHRTVVRASLRYGRKHPERLAQALMNSAMGYRQADAADRAGTKREYLSQALASIRKG
jgi:hypothetical protein